MMAVAKSYEKFEVLGEPFVSDGKEYVRVKGACPRCGGSGHYAYNPVYGTTCFQCNGAGKVVKEVRWYTDAERARMDKAADKRAEDRAAKIIAHRLYINGPEKNGFGTADGHITMLVGNSYPVKDQLKAAGCKYSPVFGWYIPNGVEYDVPAEFELESLEIRWETVSKDNEILPASELETIISELTRKPSSSLYQGEIGEKITVEVKVTGNHTFSGYYGDTHIHTFEDVEGNVYVWSTASKSLEVGANLVVTGTIKDHKEYKGVQQTVLTRCKVKEAE